MSDINEKIKKSKLKTIFNKISDIYKHVATVKKPAKTTRVNTIIASQELASMFSEKLAEALDSARIMANQEIRTGKKSQGLRR